MTDDGFRLLFAGLRFRPVAEEGEEGAFFGFGVFSLIIEAGGESFAGGFGGLGANGFLLDEAGALFGYGEAGVGGLLEDELQDFHEGPFDDQDDGHAGKGDQQQVAGGDSEQLYEEDSESAADDSAGLHYRLGILRQGWHGASESADVTPGYKS